MITNQNHSHEKTSLQNPCKDNYFYLQMKRVMIFLKKN